MNKLWTLVKNNFINSFNINKIFKRKNKDQLSLIFTILVGLAGILIFFFFGLYMYFYGEMFVRSGRSDGVLLLGIFFGLLVIAISSVSKTNSYLFASKDFDLLMSLPIKTNIVFLSKVINLLIINYVMFAYFYLPAIIVYSMFNVVNVLYWVFSFLGFFFIPLPIIAVFGYLSCLFGKVKISENLKKVFSISLSILLVILIIITTMGLNSDGSDEAIFFENMYNSFKKVNYFGYICFLGIKGSALNFTFALGLSLILFGLFFVYASKNYLSINTNQKDIIIKNKKKAKEEKKVSPKIALIKKEIRGYFSFPIYVVNTIIGPILSVVFLLFLFYETKGEYLQVGNKLIEMRFILPPISLFLVIFSASITSTTSSSISLEGKNLWIIKTLPVKEKDIFNAKIFVNLIITIPFIIIDSIIIYINIRLTVLEMLFFVLIPIVVVMLVSEVGLFINLLFPKISFEQPAQVVKQSLSVLVTMIVTGIMMILFLIFAVAIYLLCSNLIISYLFVMIFSIVLIIIMKLIINTKGVRLFNKIIC